LHHESDVLSVPTSVVGTGKNQVHPDKESTGDAPVLSHFLLRKKSLTKTDWCAGESS